MAVTTGRFRMLRGTAAQFSSLNPVLQAGEPGYTTDTRVLKIGDGTTAWNSLSTITAGTTDHGALTGLLDDDHPQYALLADAVALSDSTPLAQVQNGFAGTAITASRGDHKHPTSTTLPSLIPATSGQWMTPQRVSSTGAFTINRLCMVPYWIDVKDNRAIVISAIGVNATGAGSSDSTCEAGFYLPQANGYPDLTQKLVSVTITTGNTTGNKTGTLGSNYTFPASPIFVWAATIVHGTTSPTFSTVDVNSQWPRLYSPDDGSMNQPQHFAATGQTSLPTTQIGLGNGNEPAPVLYIKPV
jgi:hypothetical protein